MPVKPDTTPDENLVAPAAVVPPTSPEIARISRLDEMKKYFKTQPRVRVKVRNDGDVPVQINGYTFLVQSNVSVEVPQDVADLLEAAGYI